jgi:hypothetical protein
MKHFFALVYLLISSPFTFASENSISQSLEISLRDNKMARSLFEWEQSSTHPNRLFREWRIQSARNIKQKADLQLQICQSFMKLNGISLSLFENEIQDRQNLNLISKCKKPLLSRIEDFYQSQKKKGWSLEVNNFRFPDNVQKRDTKDGYYAVTGDVAKKEIILTFDDGPSVYTESIMKSLNEVNAKAIFLC